MGLFMKREVLEEMVSFKREIDLLLNRGFFKDLLEVYKELAGLDGFQEFVNLMECCEQKRIVLSHLIWQLRESNVLSIAKKISSLVENMENEYVYRG